MNYTVMNAINIVLWVSACERIINFKDFTLAAF